MRAQNLYNGDGIVGCRFAFTLPVELPPRPHAENDSDSDFASLEAASITNTSAIPE